ncbi:cupin domain-containing protein [Pseudoclavibacter helvolus]
MSGEPTTAALELGAFAGAEFGLWEMSAGSMFDVEADEVFLVISGTATVEFLEPALPPIDLEPGSIVRLGEGMRTRWTVTGAPLRKLYLVEGGS